MRFDAACLLRGRVVNYGVLVVASYEVVLCEHPDNLRDVRHNVDGFFGFAASNPELVK